MGKPQNTVIEINGQKYDARTGKLIQSSTPTRSTAPIQSIDGVARPVRHSKELHSKNTRSNTLMRHAVKKPTHPLTLKADVTRNRQVQPSHNVHTKPALKSIYQPNQLRVKRAQEVKQNTLVKRFNDVGVVSSQPTAITAPKSHTPNLNVQKSKPTKSHSVIEEGLRAAQSHKQPHHKAPKSHRKSKFASLAAASMAVFLLVGFFGFQYAPNISMRYAAARSGVNANMPGYSPSGFSLNNHIHYTPGQITLTFRSNSDERQFNIVQRESNWNSETLRANYVANIDKSVHTYEDKGRTIYIYGGSNATWVSGGVWYEIQGNSQLTSDQLIQIASSM